MKTEISPARLLLRILLVFLLVLAAYYAFAATDLYQRRVFDPYVRLNASASAGLLRWIGHDAVARGATLASPEFRLEVGRGCDGIEPTMLFVAALLAFPAPLRRKLAALVVCVPLLSAVNLVRVVSLFLTGIHAPDLFQVMHVEVWQVLYIGLAIGVFGVWLAWTSSRPTGPPQPAAWEGG